MSEVLVTIHGESGKTEQFRMAYVPTLQAAYDAAIPLTAPAHAGRACLRSLAVTRDLTSSLRRRKGRDEPSGIGLEIG